MNLRDSDKSKPKRTVTPLHNMSCQPSPALRAFSSGYDDAKLATIIDFPNVCTEKFSASVHFTQTSAGEAEQEGPSEVQGAALALPDTEARCRNVATGGAAMLPREAATLQKYDTPLTG